MDRKQEIEAELIRIQNEKDEYLAVHRERALGLKTEYWAEVQKTRAAELREQADRIERGEDVPTEQVIGVN